jgi:5-methylcytosine-specific restriction endonuclease McrA
MRYVQLQFRHLFSRNNCELRSREEALKLASEIGLEPPNGEEFVDDDFRLHTYEEGMQFYASKSWKALRDQFLVGRELECCACGLDLQKHRNMLTVDHVESVRWNWWRRFDQRNLQILCKDCNALKGNRRDPDLAEVAKRTLKDRREYELRVLEEERSKKLAPYVTQMLVQWRADLNEMLTGSDVKKIPSRMDEKRYFRTRLSEYVAENTSGTDAQYVDIIVEISNLYNDAKGRSCVKKWAKNSSRG